MAAIGVLESGEKEPSILLLGRMARQIAAWTRTELADIGNEDIKARYAGKKRPKGSRQKVIKARAMDQEPLTKKEMEYQEKEQKMEGNAKARAENVRTKTQNDSVVGKGKGKAVMSCRTERERGTQ